VVVVRAHPVRRRGDGVHVAVGDGPGWARHVLEHVGRVGPFSTASKNQRLRAVDPTDDLLADRLPAHDRGRVGRPGGRGAPPASRGGEAVAEEQVVDGGGSPRVLLARCVDPAKCPR
jgi:hypothetical protein